MLTRGPPYAIINVLYDMYHYCFHENHHRACIDIVITLVRLTKDTRYICNILFTSFFYIFITIFRRRFTIFIAWTVPSEAWKRSAVIVTSGQPYCDHD